MSLREPVLGFLLVCHKNYPYKLGEKFAEKAVDELKRRGINVIYPGKAILDLDDAEIGKTIRNSDVDLAVLMTGTWVEAPIVIKAIDELRFIPIVLWSFPMFIQNGRVRSTGSMPAAAVLRATLEEMGFKFKYVHGAVDDPQILEKISKYAKVAFTFKMLRKSRIGLLGYASMGMYTATFDHVTLRARIGPEVEHIDNYTLIKMMREIPHEEINKTAVEIKKRYFVDPDVKEEELHEVSKTYLAFKKIIESLRLNALTPKCQYELSLQYGRVPCAPLSMLADEKIVCSCEGDVHLTVTMMILYYLTGKPVYYGDVLDVKDKKLMLSSCGFAPLSLASNPKHMGLRMFSLPGHSIGLRSSIVLKPGRVTVARLEGRKGTYRMHIATGEAAETDLREGVFPNTEIFLDGDPEEFIQNLLSQHYAVVYADVKKELIDLCELLDVKSIVT